MASFAPREGAAPARVRHSQFYGDYTLADWDPADNSGRLWLFGAPGIPDAALPERTSLQRGAKELLLQGKLLGSGLGLLKL